MVGEEAEVLLQQFRKQPTLIFRDDAVADAREHHGLAIDRGAPQREHQERQHAGPDHARDIALDVGLIDDVAGEIGVQRRAGRGDAHQGEGDRVALPARGSVVGQQSTDQAERAARLGAQWWQVRFKHPRTVTRQERRE